jgi:repressor LexA
MNELTDAQEKVLNFIIECIDRAGIPPTCRQICKHCNYKSPKAASDHLAMLERKGYIRREPGRSRNIELLEKCGIPLLGSIQAGRPNSGDAMPLHYLSLNPRVFGIQSRDRAFALKVRGDSMEGRNIIEGDIVVLERGADPRHKDVVAALIDNETSLKTLIRKDAGVWLHAENPRCPDLIPETSLEIQGVARAVIRHLRP